MEVVKNIYRTHTCGELNINNVEEEVKNECITKIVNKKKK